MEETWLLFLVLLVGAGGATLGRYVGNGIRSFLRLVATCGRFAATNRDRYSKRSKAFDGNLFRHGPLEGRQCQSGLAVASYHTWSRGWGVKCASARFSPSGKVSFLDGCGAVGDGYAHSMQDFFFRRLFFRNLFGW
jgi:hypothetical protein